MTGADCETANFVTPLSYRDAGPQIGIWLWRPQAGGGHKGLQVAVAALGKAACLELLGRFAGEKDTRNNFRGARVMEAGIHGDATWRELGHNSVAPPAHLRAHAGNMCNKDDGRNTAYLFFR